VGRSFRLGSGRAICHHQGHDWRALSHTNLLSNVAQVAAHIPLDPHWLWFNPLPGRYVFADKVFCCARTCHGCSLTAELPNGTCRTPLFQRQGSCHRQACHALQLTFFSDPTWETAIIGGLS